MGRSFVHTLGDCAEYHLVVEIVCGGCGRAVYRAATELIGLTVRGSFVIPPEMPLAMLGTVLRCRGAGYSTGCGAKEAKARALRPRELGIPPGVDPLAFLNADDRERRRLVRLARG